MKQRRPALRHPIVVGVVVLTTAVLLFAGVTLWRVAVAMLAMYLILRMGVAVIGGLAQPLPEPPPAGELRKVKITYRCDICGTEVRMLVSPSEEPVPPRHCQDDMRMMTPVD